VQYLIAIFACLVKPDKNKLGKLKQIQVGQGRADRTSEVASFNQFGIYGLWFCVKGLYSISS